MFEGVTTFELVVVAVIIGIFAIVADISITDSERYVRYDCRVAEISPDVPVQVKELCRRRK